MNVRMTLTWALAPAAALIMLGCGGKKVEPDPGTRSATVIDKGSEPAKPTEPPPTVATEVQAPAPDTHAAEPDTKVAAADTKAPEPDTTPAADTRAPEPDTQPPEPKPPEGVDQPEPGSGAQALAPDLMVTDAAVTDAVVDRMPSARKTDWKIGEDTKLIGWFEFKNPGGKVDVDLVWKKNGVENWRFPTSVGTGKNWRTWAEKRITKKDAGKWQVDVVDANGHVYESVTYTVE